MSESSGITTVRSPAVSSTQAGSLEAGLGGNYHFELGEVLHEAWVKTKGAKGTFVLALVLYMVVFIAADAVLSFAGLGQSWGEEAKYDFSFWLGSLIQLAVVTPMVAGFWIMGIRRAGGMEIRPTTIFDYYKQWLPIFFLTLMLYVLVAVGFVLLVIPGLYLAIGYCLALPLVVEKGMEPWEALETSRKTVTHRWLAFFGLFIVLFVINLATIFTLFIGLIWTIPMSQIAAGILYRRVFGILPDTLQEKNARANVQAGE